MFTCSRGVLAPLSLLLAALALSACPSSRRCAGVELCNGKDDNCDGRVDEGFVDAMGRYNGAANCGRCGVSCEDVFPSAETTVCDAKPAVPTCRLQTCRKGLHPVNGTECVADEVALCLPCERDSDCSARTPGALCLELPDQRRCGTPCSATQACPSPFRCDSSLGQCVPEGSFCACQHEVTEPVEVACLGRGSAPDLYCAGIATCSARGLSACRITATESCDGEDDDCDGQIDEDFRDAQGRYVSRLHCGACNKPCSPPGEHYEATCVADSASTRCEIACTPGFVDVDKIQGNGCECQRFDGSNAPGASGGDNDCDGVVDDDTTFVHVATFGNDNAAGTLLAPLRSIRAGVQRGAEQGKAVLVAQGNYDAFEIVAGVSVFGGYRTDFGARDPALYPVVVEHQNPTDGAPVLTCRGVEQASVVDGLTLVGQDATTFGRGSTAVLFDGCGPAIKLAHVVVLSGRGADGANGADAASRLPGGIPSLAALAGRDGIPGATNTNTTACVTVPGGGAAQKTCGAVDVSGGAGGAAACANIGCSLGRPCANAGCTDFTRDGVCDYATVLALAVANPGAESGRGTQPGAAGQATYNAPTSRGECSFCDDNPTLPRLGEDGQDGESGPSGAGGAGCVEVDLTLDALGRGTAKAGLEGQAGASGSGGGGGSAGNGYSVVPGTTGSCSDVAGGSGGSGGSGGCGAPSGAGGTGGGASLGLLVRPNAAGFGPTFDSVRVVTASGGRGGDGGIGAAGGRGGLGAPGGTSQFWCARSGGRGGDGGEGGSGGGGGGGCGGATHALLLGGSVSDAYRSQVQATLAVELAGVAGQGGRGGFSPGVSGVAGRTGSDLLIR